MNSTAWKRLTVLGLTCTLIAGAGALAIDDTASQDDGEAKKAEIGKPAPDFVLKDLEGKEHKLSDHNGKIVVLEWFNPECPFVFNRYREGSIQRYSKELQKQDIVWIAINSGAPGEQGTGLEKNLNYFKKWEMPHPLLLDEPGDVGRMYDARTTPHMYIIDKEGILRYHGAYSNAPRGTVRGDGEKIFYFKNAIAQIKAGETVSPEYVRPWGCTVKYARTR